MKKLNPRQQQFAREFLVDMNASAAARRAGYSERTAGSQGFDLLKKPEIQEFIQKALAEQSERTEITADYVLKMSRELLDRCMQKEPVLDSDGCPTGEWRFDSAGAARALKLLGDHCAIAAFQPGVGPPAVPPGDTKWVVEVVHTSVEEYRQRLKDEAEKPALEHKP